MAGLESLNLCDCRTLTGSSVGATGSSSDVFLIQRLRHPDFSTHHYTGNITPSMVVWISGIKEKNLNNCGKFVLGDMGELAITKVDLSDMNTLEGNVPCRCL